MLVAQQYERYSRQISLSEIGEIGQQKLLDAKVLVIGAGGLGCPVLQYLTAMGVGCLGIADNDVVSLSNLHRQILFNTEDVGKLKTTVAKEKLEKINPDIQFRIYKHSITNINAWEILSDYDLVIDGSDNFTTRYLVNDACILLNKPLVHGSIFKFEGQVSVFNHNGSANYRNVFAEPPKNGEVPDCSEAGVTGVLPGIIGSLMANEAFKIITNTGKLLTNCLLTYNSLNNTFYEIEIEKGNATGKNIPANRDAFEKMDYAFSCENSLTDIEITSEEFDKFIKENQSLIIDIREKAETPFVTEFEHEKIPMNELLKNKPITKKDTIVLFCQTGKRSREAATILRNNYSGNLNFFSLRSGIVQWKKEQKNISHE